MVYPSLCLDPGKLHAREEKRDPFDVTDVGVQLTLLPRPNGVYDPATEDGGGDDARLGPMYTEPSEPNGVGRLTDLINDLESTSRTAYMAAWVSAITKSLGAKKVLYRREASDIIEEIKDQHGKVQEFVRLSKLPIEDINTTRAPPNPPATGPDPPNSALADPSEKKWDIAKESQGPFDRWRTLVAQKASIKVVLERCDKRLSGLGSASGRGEWDLPQAKKAFLDSLKNMKQYDTQSKMLDILVDIVKAFISNAVVSQNAFINMILMGNPGTGKTRLAKGIAEVLGSLGMFVYGGKDYVETGRSDFIAEYLGQTAIKTRTFLLSNLEKVVFLDEAYSLTTWTTKANGERELDQYGEESATEIVAFLSQNVGKIGMLCAGYEGKMRDDFLPANDGFSRRFPYQFVLQDYRGAQLVDIFLKSLVEALSTKTYTGATRATRKITYNLTYEKVKSYFTVPARVLLSDICEGSRKVTRTPIQADDPRYETGEIGPNDFYDEVLVYPSVNTIFAAQAGAMVNLANVAAILLMSNPYFDKLGDNDPGVRINRYAVDYRSMYNIVLTLMQRSLAGTITQVRPAQQQMNSMLGVPQQPPSGPSAPSNPPAQAPPAPPAGGALAGGGGAAMVAPPPMAAARQAAMLADDDGMDAGGNSSSLDSLIRGSRRAQEREVYDIAEWKQAKEQLDEMLVYYGWMVMGRDRSWYWKVGDNVQSFIEEQTAAAAEAEAASRAPPLSFSPAPSMGGESSAMEEDAPPPPAALPQAVQGRRRGRSGGAVPAPPGLP